MKLNKQNLNRLAPEVVLPAYALSDTRQGIAHIGVGGFTGHIRRITPTH